MIEIKNLIKRYKNNKGIDNVSYIFPSDGLIVLKGESGSGKTTLLKLLAKKIKPTSGDVIYNIKEKYNINELYKKSISYVDVNDNLLVNYTIYQNIELIYQLMNKKINKKEIENLFQTYNLEDKLNKLPTQLSSGEVKFVSLIINFLKDSDIYILDEPTANLDKERTIQIIALLEELSRKKLVIVATHEEKIVANADELFLVKDRNITLIKKNNNVKKSKMMLNVCKYKVRLHTYLNYLFYESKKEKIKYFITIFLLSLCAISFNIIKTFEDYDQIKEISQILEFDEVNLIDLVKFSKEDLGYGVITYINNLTSDEIKKYNDYWINYKFEVDQFTAIYELDTKDNIVDYNHNYEVIGEELLSVKDVYVTDYIIDFIYGDINYESIINSDIYIYDKVFVLKGIVITDYEKLDNRTLYLGKNSYLGYIYTKINFYNEFFEEHVDIKYRVKENDYNLFDGEYTLKINNNLDNNEISLYKEYDMDYINLSFTNVEDYTVNIDNKFDYIISDLMSNEEKVIEVNEYTYNSIRYYLVGDIKGIVMPISKNYLDIYSSLKLLYDDNLTHYYYNISSRLIIFDDLLIVLSNIFILIKYISAIIGVVLLINLSLEKKNKDELRIINKGFSLKDINLLYFLKSVILSVFTISIASIINFYLVLQLNNLVRSNYISNVEILKIDYLYLISIINFMYMLYYIFLLIKGIMHKKNVFL